MVEVAVDLPAGIRYHSVECPVKEILVVPRKSPFRPIYWREGFFIGLSVYTVRFEPQEVKP